MGPLLLHPSVGTRICRPCLGQSVGWALAHHLCLWLGGLKPTLRGDVTGDVAQELHILALDPKGTCDIRAHPVICDGRLYLRCHDTLYCYDVLAK